MPHRRSGTCSTRGLRRWRARLERLLDEPAHERGGRRFAAATLTARFDRAYERRLQRRLMFLEI